MHATTPDTSLSADTARLLQADGASQAMTEKKVRELLARRSLGKLFTGDSVQEALKATFACLRRRCPPHEHVILTPTQLQDLLEARLQAYATANVPSLVNGEVTTMVQGLARQGSAPAEA